MTFTMKQKIVIYKTVNNLCFKDCQRFLSYFMFKMIIVHILQKQNNNVSEMYVAKYTRIY